MPHPVAAARRRACPILLTACLAGASTARSAEPPGVERILEGLPVSTSQWHVQMTPVATFGDAVYIANVEPGERGDPPRGLGLRTVLRKGVPDGAGGWRWSASLVDDNTAHDIWHSAPGIGVDETGRVHIAYNMHNLPWQYAVTAEPGNIDSVEFRGQAITDAELERYRFENKTNFPTLGSAAIPGNQVTYPAFVNDAAGRLYVTYRFAAKPQRAFERRTMSSGAARHDAATGAWESLGGLLDFADGDFAAGGTTDPDSLRAIASETGWTSYAANLMPRPGGGFAVSSMWREGIAGASTTRPCVIMTDDGTSFTTMEGTPIAMPLGPADCGNVGAPDGRSYRSINASVADSAGRPALLLDVIGGAREIRRWTGTGWARQDSPSGATEIFFDAADNLWAVGSGLQIQVQRAGTEGWEVLRAGDGRVDCFPRAGLDRGRRIAFLYAQGCDTNGANRASVTRVDLGALLGTPLPASDAALAAAPTVGADAAGAGADASTDADAEAPAGDVPGTGSADADPSGSDPGDGTPDGTPSAAGTQGAAATPAGLPDAACDPALPANQYDLPSRQWRMLTLPCVPPAGENTLGAVLGDDIEGDYGTDWIVYAYDPEAGYVDPGPDAALAPGAAFWIVQAGPDAVLDLPEGSRRPVGNVPPGEACLSGEACLAVPLGTAPIAPPPTPGSAAAALAMDPVGAELVARSRSTREGDPAAEPTWSLVGSPWPGPAGVAVDALRIVTLGGPCAAGCPLPDAAAAGLVAPGLFHYDGDAYLPPLSAGAVLSAWEGYWLAAAGDAPRVGTRLVWPY